MFRVWSARHPPLAQVAMAFGLGALLLILAFLQVHTLSGRPEQPQSRGRPNCVLRACDHGDG